jgi:hypothetical protein
MKVILTTPEPPCPDPPPQHLAQFPQYELTPDCPPPAGQSMWHPHEHHATLVTPTCILPNCGADPVPEYVYQQ